MAQTDIRGKHLRYEENGMVSDQRDLDKTVLLLAEKGVDCQAKLTHFYIEN